MRDNLLRSKLFVRVSEYTSPTNDFLDLYEEDAVVDHIIKKLQILRGTYVFDPTYGCDLVRYLFEPMNEVTEAAIRREVESVIKEYPSIINYSIELVPRENFKEYVVNIILNFRSGKTYGIEIGRNATSATAM